MPILKSGLAFLFKNKSFDSSSRLEIEFLNRQYYLKCGKLKMELIL